MPPRVQALQASAQHGHRFAAALQRPLMRGAIDPQCQTAGDDETTARQATGKGPRVIQAGLRGASTADHGQLRRLQHTRIARHEQQRRRIRQLAEQSRIGWIVPHHHMLIRLTQPVQGSRRSLADLRTAPGLGAGSRQPQRTPGAGRRTERSRGAIESAQEFAKASRPQLWQ